MLRPDERDRRDRLIAEIRPALMRMAGRYRRKAGLPWQWREDHCHDLVLAAMRAFGRYRHLSDHDLRRVMVRTAANESKDAIRRAVAEAQSGPSIERTDQIDLIAVRDDAAKSVEAFEVAEWFAVVARSGNLESQEIAVLLATADGVTAAEIAIDLGCCERTVKYRLQAARKKIAPHVARLFPEFRYTVSPLVSHTTGDTTHDAD